MNASERLHQFAGEQGFDLFGVTPAGPSAHTDDLRAWLAQGYAAGMEWMGRDPDRRMNPGSLLPDAKSVVVVGMSYSTEMPPERVWNDPLRGRVSRYAWGPDYHDILLPRLEALARFIGEDLGGDVRWRAYVDTGPVLERGMAEKAGIGFIGRNTMLISRERGSLVFLGEIVTDAVLEPRSAGVRQSEAGFAGCGRCRRCLDACPTGAFPREYVLDAGRCISYQTIENRGSIPADIRPRMGSWIFGCDDCQSVCPWVRKFSRPGRERFLAFDADRFAPWLSDVLGMGERVFRERYEGTPVLRAKWRGFLRNAIVALGNSGGAAAEELLRPLAASSEPLIREHAQWALERARAVTSGDGAGSNP